MGSLEDWAGMTRREEQGQGWQLPVKEAGRAVGVPASLVDAARFSPTEGLGPKAGLPPMEKADLERRNLAVQLHQCVATPNTFARTRLI